MSGLGASRWAATPPPANSPAESTQKSDEQADLEPENEEGLVVNPDAESHSVTVNDHEATSEDTEKPLPELPVNEVPLVAEEEAVKNGDTTEANVNEQKADGSDHPDAIDDEMRATATEKVENSTRDADALIVATPTLHVSAEQSIEERHAEQVPGPQWPPEHARLDPPRLRKKVSWRGRNLVVCVPQTDLALLGLKKPLSDDEVQQRLKQFQDEGYDTSGFDVAASADQNVFAKPIFPDETELRTFMKTQTPNVTLPDLHAWGRYIAELTEVKLAALGVSSGLDEPARSPSQDMSRQSSSHFPTQTFSPPIPTGSAASMGRPSMIRAHSHTMSVASPISPINSPFGHMHRHSTFHGIPPLQNQLQHDSQRQVPMPGLQAFPPPFPAPQMHRVGSPAQVAALRYDAGLIRGPGSPLSQTLLQDSLLDYNRSLREDQRQRQPGQFQNGMLPSNPHLTQRAPPEPALLLPELPEDEDEDELSDPVPYVPPHKRAQINEDIAVPTPRHRHNISEGLERGILQAEQHQESTESRDTANQMDGFEPPLQSGRRPSEKRALENDPLSGDYPVQDSGHNRKKSASRFNVAAPPFTFNPNASFQPGSAAFTLDSRPTTINGAAPAKHTRQASSGNFNVAAKEFKPSNVQSKLPPNVPEFKPSNVPSLPTSEFSFSSQGPTGEPEASAKPPSKPANRTVIDDLPSIFGELKMLDIVKPVKQSKAVAIVKPSNGLNEVASDTDVEDEDGRLGRKDERQKRSRAFDRDDGNEVPRFAEPHPFPVVAEAPVMPSQPSDDFHVDNATTVAGDQSPSDRETKSMVEEIEHQADKVLEEIEPKALKTLGDQIKPHDDPHHADRAAEDTNHEPKSSLSAVAETWESSLHSEVLEPSQAYSDEADDHESVSLEDGEIKENSDTYADIEEKSWALPSPPHENKDFQFPAPSGTNKFPKSTTSFDEIDAVMQHLNAEGSPAGDIERLNSPEYDQHFNPLDGVTYIPTQPRSPAPEPSPRRHFIPYNPLADPSSTIHDEGNPRETVWPSINRLNKAPGPPSEWSDMVSPGEEEKFHTRSTFFDNRINDVIGRVLEGRLKPFEESLRSIQTSLEKRPPPVDPRLFKQRSSSAMDSDADDEDDSEAQSHRPISRGRDQKLGHIKAIVLEALHEQSPRRSQSSYDISDLHSALADMKVSFARAASASLELEDIRAIVEDVISAQSQALVPHGRSREDMESDRRQIVELESRLNETLTGALEQANYTRQVEQREAETKRMLSLAEEELHLLRDTNRDDDSRVKALEEERTQLLDRVDEAEDAQIKAEAHLKSVQAESDAIQATLDEYRLSSTKWRREIDDGEEDREEMESHIATLERQLEEAQESGGSIRRRLEKIHDDMATAAGQLASEKSRWNVREEEYRARCEALEAQDAAHAQEKVQLEEELHLLRAGAAEAATTRTALDSLQSTNASLDEVARKLHNDLGEQQALAARFERELNDVKEAGREEVHRTRMTLGMEVEAANQQVHIVRAELEGEIARARAELDDVRMEADTNKERHALVLDQEAGTAREALRKANHTSSVALDEARAKYELAIKDLTQQQNRSLAHAIEDKERSEYILNERLALANAKIHHFEDRVLHLEERVEVAKAAAQAAAMKAQISKAATIPTNKASVPEKVSPQALRESILVLQEQLQARESRIEELQQEQKTEGPAQLKERDTEIAWLRELIAVRSEDLAELVNTLSRPTFDRDAVRDTAIRIRANLQMEQQEKDRSGQGTGALPSQAIASLSSFATPKAAQLTSAFNKWRASMESSSLKVRPAPVRSYTPSRPPSAPKAPAYMSGLMTPPASNLRNTPSPETVTLMPSRTVSSRSGSQARKNSIKEVLPQVDASEPPSTPTLFGVGNYDDDAEDKNASMSNFEDEDLNIADSQPPAFRSLEEELEPVETGAM